MKSLIEVAMSKRAASMLRIICVLIAALSATTFGYDSWAKRNPVQQSSTINAIYQNGTQWVAVGNGGIALTSTDGLGWASHPTITSNALYAVTSGGGQYVAVGQNATIMTSTDGIAWTIRNSGSATLRGVTWSNGVYVAVGDGGTILSSSDGYTWATSVSVSSDPWYTVRWINNKFLALGGGAFNSKYATSTDGQTWTSTTFGLAQPYALAWSGSLYVAVGIQGRVLTSTNGTSWSLGNGIYNMSSQDFKSVVWTGTQFVASNATGMVFTSPDGISWTSRTSNVSNALNTLVWDGSKVIAMGTNGTFASSPTGETWTSYASAITSKSLGGVAWGNNRFIATGDSGSILTSSDGQSWTSQSSPASGKIYAITWTGSQFVAVSDSGSIITSPDGTTWTSRTTPLKAFLWDVTSNGSLIVATGATGSLGTPSVILTSSDGVTWTRRTSGGGSILAGVAWGSGKFVTVGTDGQVWTSTDGVTWTFRSSGYVGPTLLYGVSWAGDKFIATGSSGILITSPDGITWTSRTSGSAQEIRKVIWTGTTAIAVGFGGKILTSPDGITWTSRYSGLGGTNFFGVGAGPSRVAVVGASGTILTADRLVPNISYTSPQALVAGLSSSALPSNSGSAANSWRISPALPSGISLDTASGTITGNHSGELAAASYTIIATNTFEADTTVLNLAVQEPMNSITYTSPNPMVYSLGEGITMNRATISGGTIGRSIELQSGTLPTGLSLSSVNGNIYGTTAQTGHFPVTVRVSNLLGSVTASLDITVRDPMPAISYAPGSFAYPLNSAITTLAPENAGGAVRRWSITPDLAEKTGLTFNPTTGKIFGTPTKISTDTLFTITAVGISEAYSNATPVTIKITPVAPTVTYANTPFSYPMGTEITPISKTGATGIITGYSIAPTLPAGLVFNPTTGRISGTPAVVSAATDYIITAIGLGTTGMDTVSIATTGVPPTVSYPDTTLTWNVGTEITPFSKLSAAGRITGYSVSPALPAGLALNPTTGKVSGTPTTAVSATQYTFSATGPGGTGSDTVLIATIVDAPVLDYVLDTVKFVLGNEITAFRPVNTGGRILGWSISLGSNGKSLTANTGLLFNPTTGKILGTPVYDSDPTAYTITAFGLSGSQAQAVINLQTFTILLKRMVPESESFSFRVNGRSGSSYSLRIPLAFGTAERVTVSVADLSGRSVWSKEVNAKDGVRELIWDGNGTNGRAVSAGMYTVRVTARLEGKTVDATGKVVDIKP